MDSLTEWASSGALLLVKQIAESTGFKGDFRQWEDLLRIGVWIAPMPPQFTALAFSVCTRGPSLVVVI